MLYVAAVTMLAVILIKACNVGFTRSLDRMRSLRSLDFTAEGYRDLQIQVGGVVGVLCFSAALVSGLFAGALFPNATFLSVASGVAISLGAQGALYILFGIFLGHQISQIFTISTPAILGAYGRGVKRFVSFGITTMIVLFLATFWCGLFWLTVKIGGLTSG